MPYCTLDDLKAQVEEAVLIRLTDDEGAGVVNQPRVDAALEAADGEIDSYCRAKYQTPFNPVPTVIRNVAVDISLYRLFSRRGFDPESADKIVADRYQGAIRFLEQLARGLVTIGAPAPPTTPAVGIDVQGPPRVFRRSTMEGF